MTELRCRMIANMRLRGLSPTTQRSYVDAIKDLANRFRTSFQGRSLSKQFLNTNWKTTDVRYKVPIRIHDAGIMQKVKFSKFT
ncbi:hypothetical protein ES703_49059 [subsurface metagenome]